MDVWRVLTPMLALCSGFIFSLMYRKASVWTRISARFAVVGEVVVYTTILRIVNSTMSCILYSYVPRRNTEADKDWTKKVQPKTLVHPYSLDRVELCSTVALLDRFLDHAIVDLSVAKRYMIGIAGHRQLRSIVSGFFWIFEQGDSFMEMIRLLTLNMDRDLQALYIGTMRLKQFLDMLEESLEHDRDNNP
ncbi:hypothetical protein IV203_038331 [Nitzschia inconspicua]|uniref:Uncharacterized protein n=1 Tax=Nitzschia inconspicua TaxID=303405 RepID=A0A9K3PZ62_9STRA|nr:hypothetical protein IV203_038331 [Nitzschia inconspicua]